MANRDILAIGTSAGGFEALRFLASEFAPDFPASILVTIHLSSQFRTHLDAILSKSGPLPAIMASDGQPLERGRIYIAPPERHLLIDGERLLLGTGPRENSARPAIDPMLRSAALCCGARSIGVILTGTLADGASGLWALKQCGGITVVQDPRDAAYPEMPATALSRTQPDHVAALAAMPALLEQLVQEPVGEPAAPPHGIDYEVEIAKSGRSNMKTMDRVGRRSVLACPDCHGIMWEIGEGDLVRYRCHVGHAYTAELMSLALEEGLTRALASALRALEERIAVARKLQAQATQSGHATNADSWSRKALEFEREAEVIRTSIRRLDQLAAAQS